MITTELCPPRSVFVEKGLKHGNGQVHLMYFRVNSDLDAFAVRTACGLTIAGSYSISSDVTGKPSCGPCAAVLAEWGDQEDPRVRGVMDDFGSGRADTRPILRNTLLRSPEGRRISRCLFEHENISRLFGVEPAPDEGTAYGCTRCTWPNPSFFQMKALLAKKVEGRNDTRDEGLEDFVASLGDSTTLKDGKGRVVVAKVVEVHIHDSQVEVIFEFDPAAWRLPA